MLGYEDLLSMPITGVNTIWGPLTKKEIADIALISRQISFNALSSIQ